MKKPAKITYLVLRIAMGLLLILAGVGFFINNDPSVKSNYIFICGQCALFLIVSFTPLFIKRLDLDIPDFVYIVFILFCMAHFFLGEIVGFFATVKWWDSALHTLSGMLITLLSFSIINILNKHNDGDFKLSVGFVCLFAFCITITIGVLWEIVEFSADGIFDLNMQRAYESTVSGARGAGLVGREALQDTMKDLILDAIGAAVVCIGCSIFVIKSGASVDKLMVIKKRKKHEETVAINAETQPIEATTEANLESTEDPKINE